MTLLDSWINLAREKGASDLHLEPGSPMVLRIRGDLSPLGESISGERLLEATKDLLGTKRWQDFLAQRSADLSQTVAGTRCRIHVYQALRGVSLAIRLLSSFSSNLRDCNLHPDLARLLAHETGLLLVSGPTGSGKSTTLAAFIEEINASRRRHIITIESPIEYYFRNRKSFIRQREIKNHTPGFEQAIVDSMRQDPDVLVIGEMRTPDVMRLTLNAAETGHLVFSTIHSSSCAEALARLCLSFPSDIQPAICNQVADCLIGVICQRLTYYPKFQVRVPVCEVLVATSGVKGAIRGGHFAKLPSSIQTGGDDGMWTIDRYRRWADEKSDWIHPSSRPLNEEKDEIKARIELSPTESQPTPGKLNGPPAAPREPREPNERLDPRRIEITDPDENLEEVIEWMNKIKEPK